MLFTHRSTKHAAQLVDAVANSYSQRLFPDVTIVVDDERIPAHRFILAAMCPYFSTMFSSGMKEATEKEITLKGMDASVVGQVIEYLYTGCIGITADLAPGLLQAADMYDLEDLRNGCIHFYSGSISPDTCLAIWKLGTELQDRFLTNAAFDVAAANFKYVVEQVEDFLELSVDEVAQYLACENLQVESSLEEEVFDAALKWLQANPKSAAHFHRVVSRIGLMYIDPKVLDKKYLTQKDIYVDKRVTDLIHAAINYQLKNQELPYEMNEGTVRHHGNHCDHRIVILGGSQQTFSDHYSVNSGQVLTSGKLCDSLSSLPYNLPTHSGTSYLATCFVRDVLYVSGLGEGNNEVWCYHGDRNCWMLGPNLEAGRWNHAMVLGPEFKVYVIGGYKSLKSVASVEELNSLGDVNGRKWNTTGYLCEAIGSFSALYHGNAIYTFGGQQNFHDDLDIVQKYDLLTHTCSILENMKLPVPSGTNRITTWGCYAILVNTMATIVINLETMDKLTTDAAGKLCIKYDMKQKPLFRVGPGVGLRGFSMNRIGDRIFIVGGELVRGKRGTGSYSKAVLKGLVKDVLRCSDGNSGWFELPSVQLKEPLAYHTATVVVCNNNKCHKTRVT